MDFKKFFTERLGFADKEIEIKVPNEEIPDLTEEIKEEPATKRSIFESKILRVVALTTGFNVLSHVIPERPELPPQAEQYKKEHTELSKKLGSQFDTFLLEMETYKAHKERASENIQTVVGNFEEADASSKDVKTYLEKGYPKEWLSNVQGVRLVPFDLDVPSEYGLKNENSKGSAKAIAYVEHRGELGGSSIVFSKELKNFFSSASHELGHANDWLGRTDLSDEYRINLLYGVMKRVESPDRFKSAYVESINNKDLGKQLMYKTTEYWAEIVGEYLNNPKVAKTKLAPADLVLIEQHLKVSATNFNPEKAAIAREARGKIIKQGILEKQIKLAIDESKLKNANVLLNAIREWSVVENRVTDVEDVSVPDIDAVDEESILKDVFSRGDKKWLKANSAFVESMVCVYSLAVLYVDYERDAWGERPYMAKNMKDDVGQYQESIKKMEKEIGKFPSAEQDKIKFFHRYLEKALQEAQILPTSALPEKYYK